MGIKLNFINRSNDSNNLKIVIFQKNVAEDINNEAVAWKVIQYCGPEDHYTFDFPLSMSIGACDSYGNYTPQLPASKGQLFHVSNTSSGDKLSSVGPASSMNKIECRNDLDLGAIGVSIYKNGRLLATKANVSPAQTVAFKFNPTIWIGVVNQVNEGELMSPALVSTINTELSLLGIAFADIVMTGGGPGPNAPPYMFNLDRIQMV